MDILIEAEIRTIANVLASEGFEIVNEEEKVEARKRFGLGRFHALLVQVDDRRAYLDLHWDAPLHLLFLGVDYRRRPKELWATLSRKFQEQGIKAHPIGGLNWFNRKNKAIFKGIKVRKPWSNEKEQNKDN